MRVIRLLLLAGCCSFSGCTVEGGTIRAQAEAEKFCQDKGKTFVRSQSAVNPGFFYSTVSVSGYCQ